MEYNLANRFGWETTSNALLAHKCLLIPTYTCIFLSSTIMSEIADRCISFHQLFLFLVIVIHCCGNISFQRSKQYYCSEVSWAYLGFYYRQPAFNCPLHVVTLARDLGVLVSNNLCPSAHINDIVARAHKRSYMIQCAFVSRDIDLLVRAYLVYVRPLAVM